MGFLFHFTLLLFLFFFIIIYSCIFSSLLYVVLRCPFYYITFCLPFSKQFFFFLVRPLLYIFAVLGGTFYHATSFVVCYIIIIWPSQRANGRASERQTDHQIDHTEWPSSIPFFLRWRSLHRIRFSRETLLLDTIFVPFHFLHRFVRADGWTATQTPKIGGFSEDFTGFGLSFLILIKIII